MTAVIATDVTPARLKLAARFGATGTIDVGSTPLGETTVLADVLLECSGSAPAIGEGGRRVREGGRVVLVGMGGDEVPLPLAYVQRNELKVTGTFRYAGTWPAAIALASSGRVTLDPLVTHRFGLDAAADALTVGRRDPTAVKAVVRPGHPAP